MERKEINRKSGKKKQKGEEKKKRKYIKLENVKQKIYIYICK